MLFCVIGSRIRLAALLLIVLVTGAVAAPPVWLTDLDKGVAQAKKENKSVLLFFSGSDWCPWCKRMQEEVWSKPEFEQYAAKNLVLVQVDFPRYKLLSEPQRLKNTALAKKYETYSYPTIYLLDGEGRMYGVMNFMPGGAKVFCENLEKLKKEKQ